MNNSLKRWLVLATMLAITLVLVWKAPPAEQAEDTIINAVPFKRELATPMMTANPTFNLQPRQANTSTPANLFGTPTIASPQKQIVTKPIIIAPTAPPVPYSFVGKMVENGQTKGFIQQGEVVLTVKHGDILNTQYQVMAIENDSIKVMYLPLNTPQSIRPQLNIAPPPSADEAEAPIEE